MLFKKIGCFLLFACCAIGILSGCSSKREEGQVLYLTEQSEPQSLDSALTADAISATALSNLNEGLYTVNESGDIVLGMAAKEPEISGRTYTFTLRDDIYWSNHTAQNPNPVTAYDFESAFLKTVSKDQAAEYAYIAPWKNAKKSKEGNLADGETVGVKAVSDKVLELTLEDDLPPHILKRLLAFPTFFPQSKVLVEKFGKEYAKEHDKMAYCGPFVLSRWEHDKRWTLTKNPVYYDKDKVKLDKVEVSVLKEANSQVNLFNNQSSDYAKLTFDQIDQFRGKPTHKIYPDTASVYMAFNHTKPLFQNQKIRQAVNAAIDKKEMTQNIRKDGSKPMSVWVPANISAFEGKKFRELYPDTEVVSQFNKESASKLWNEGLKELGQDTATIDLLTFDDNSSRKDAVFIQEQLKKNLGNIKINIVTLPKKVALERARRQGFDLFLGQWIADYDDPETFLTMLGSKAGTNFGRWSNKEFDAILEGLNKGTDSAKRAAKEFEAEKIIKDSTAIVPLYDRPKNVVIQTYVKGFVMQSFGGDYLLKWAYIDKT